MKRTLMLLGLIAILAGTAFGSPYFATSSYDQWQELLLAPTPGMNHIEPLMPLEWDAYMIQWRDFTQEGDPYPATTFLPPTLYVSPDGMGGNPEILPSDAGLVMAWGDNSIAPGEYASAWKFVYGMDPDLTNKIIKVTITPPQWGANGQITQVSLGMRDVNGNIRSWYWNCGTGQPIPWNVPTTVVINTALTGLAAATPAANGYASNNALPPAGFDITQVVDFIVDENAQWIFGPLPVPPTNTQVFAAMWNYWHDLIVLPNQPQAYKGTYVKYSQPIEEIEPGWIRGWDEVSVYPQDGVVGYPIMADDFPCKDERPITDFHWWGSFLNWNHPYFPPVVPRAFHIAIWTDVPAGADRPYSHPGTVVWEHVCDNWVWNFAGFDVPPLTQEPQQFYENEACFQFNQLLSEVDWFFQEPGDHIYWLSIAAIYNQGETPQYPWGWKTRPHKYMDDAVRTVMTQPWPPTIGAQWIEGVPVELEGISWDLSFEITTNQPGYCDNPIPGDFDCNKIVNLVDFATFASNWLTVVP